MQPLSIQGLVAATFTPMHSDGSLNLPIVREVVDYLIEQRIAGLYILGSTGEGLSLMHEERKQVAEAFVEAAGSRLSVIVQVGSESLLAAADLAAHAQQIGASAVSAVSPVYFKPESVNGLVDSMQQIAKSAPQLPFYYYHIPAATGLRLSILEFVSRASSQISNFRGVKFTSPEIFDFQACAETNKAELLWGVDEMLLGGVLAGARGAVGSTYNFAASLYMEMLAAIEKGNLEKARRCQSQSQEIVRTFVPFGPRAAQKAMFSLVGPDCGPPRLPICRLSSQDLDGLTRALRKTCFFELDR